MGIFRTFLAICVILEHTHPAWAMKFLSGQVAVKSFFVISGFYMSLILDSKYVGKNSYKLFITNRFLRIYPLYWAVLILTIFACVITGLLTQHWLQLSPYIALRDHMGITAFVVSAVSNMMIFGQDIVMFLGLNIKTGGVFFTENFRNAAHPFYILLFIPQAWTLALELMFYLIAPFILNKNIGLVLFLIIASLLLRYHIYEGLGWTWDPWTFRFFPTELLFFLLGNLSYKIYGRIKNKKSCWGISKFVTAAFFLIVLIYPNVHLPLRQEFAFVPYNCLVFLSLPFIFNLTKNSKIDNRIGELSYPIYLIHYLVIWLTWLLFTSGSTDLKIFLTIVLSALAAFALLTLIVDPVDRFRQSRWARQVKGEK